VVQEIADILDLHFSVCDGHYEVYAVCFALDSDCRECVGAIRKADKLLNFDRNYDH
jgi:hypothetical protein